VFSLKPISWRWKSCGLIVLVLIGVGAQGCVDRKVVPKVAFESSLFRIFDVNLPPRTALRQSYPNGVAMVVMTDGARLRMRPSGRNWGDETLPAVGSITLAEPGDHGVQNVGEEALQLLALENLRPGSGSTAAPLVATGMTSLGETASFRAYAAELADNNTQVTHVHAAPALIILIQGRVLTQGPENKDKAIGEVASGLTQLDRPGQWVFVPAGGGHYIVRLGADRARIVEVELR
jgi:hypothetical protein